MALKFTQSQRASQKQIQKLTQVQIQALNYLAMNNFDLREAIYSEADKNPALEITKDEIEDSDNSYSEGQVLLKNSALNDYTSTASVSKSAEEKADAYQKALESRADTRESLSAHLLFQFNVMNLPENQHILGTKLINNLDKNGFHILAPVSFINIKTDTQKDLDTCLDIIQNLDPAGCCCTSVEESLLVQARASKNPPDAAIFILDGHLNFLNPPVASKVLKKISDFVKEERKKSFNTVDYSFTDKFDEKQIEEAIEFIKNLNPRPARDFSSEDNAFIFADVYVEKISGSLNLNTNSGIVVNIPESRDTSFLIKTSHAYLPELSVSKEYLEISKMPGISEEQKKKLSESVSNAKQIIEMIQYREDTLLLATRAIVNAQMEFFKKGPGHLSPLVQKQIAELISVHETTVSRIANGKYLQCEWGLFPFKYFFTSGVSQGEQNKNGSPDLKDAISKERIVFEMKKLIDAQKPGEKKLSDQKICDILNSKGIKVARRTIAKYRYQLNIASSYDRV
ncbi:MAG: hypothetical protein J6Y36_03760 [Treponema sp.]|uniref:RNA polymerase factor sigma-54 n=1 Tax=Treponema sp. TaxID=166 RepID=UPI001B7525D0|nr:hypothetical protein [Treponema sp.]MBP5402257.1 hypothetical protein [Treponema sp.]MBR5933245.1 hypothetical protein [Treponema sp.]